VASSSCTLPRGVARLKQVTSLKVMQIRLAHRSDSTNPGAIAVDFDAGSFLQIVTMVILIILISRITIYFKYRTCQIKFNFTHVDRSTLLHINCIYINDENSLKNTNSCLYY
jgi:hypothetical protein